VERVEVAHAINRVKWGVWDRRDYRRLLGPVARLAERFPAVKFMGPAVIDFEYPFVLSALRELPAGLRFHALSHHLYVDRRGAPENTQAGFSLLEKCALGLAIARWSGAVDDRFIVSEVNWPLKGTGVWSPVGSPYESPGPRHNDPSVSEDAYAAYMVRYLIIALCSGFVNQVFWWRLVARGFGLADDTDPVRWRERPAFRALRQFLAVLGDSTYDRRDVAVSDADVTRYWFRRPDGERVCVAYSEGEAPPWRAPFRYSRVESGEGSTINAGAAGFTPSGLPAYFRGVIS
jgi:hypothetical protein